MREQTTERRFKRVKIKLMRSVEFVELSGIMMLGKTEIVEGFPTAATDGRNEFYGKEFLDSQPDEEVAYVICHENMHKAARHPTVYNKLWALDARCANMACDHWINLKLNAMDPLGKLIKMPSGKFEGSADLKYTGWTVKQIFDDLRAEKEKRKGEGKGDPSDGEGGFDEHEWGEAQEMTEAEKQELRRDVDQAIRQGQMAAKKLNPGSAAGGNLLGMQELLEPEVNWEEQLRQFFASTCSRKQVSSWRRPNRRMLHEGIIMPSLQGQSVSELVLGIDSSGSMHCGNRYASVLTEVKSLSTLGMVDKIHVLYWDGEVGGHEEYDAYSFADFAINTSPIGGGGTSPVCVPAFMKEHKLDPEAVIMLTDGEIGNWGEWAWPVLWVITDRDAKIIAPVGKTIHVKE